MILANLVFLYRAPGPFVSVYLDTTGNVADAPVPVRRRWKSLRRELAGAGAPEAALAAIDPLIDAADPTGDTLAVIANPGGVLLAALLPDAPAVRDVASCGMLPAVVPLLAWKQRQFPYVVVATDRLGAELLAVVPAGPDQAVRVQGQELHVTRSAPGGWSQRRFQQRAENRWQQNASAVAEALTKLVDDMRPRLVVVTGDVRATQFLRDQIPSRVDELLQVVDGEYGSLDAALARAAPLLDLLEARDTTEVLAAFGRELGQADRAADGPAATLQALANAQVSTLLLQPGGVIGDAWFGPSSAQNALHPQALHAMGVHAPVRAPLVDVALRAAAASGATVRLLANQLPDGCGPTGGIGALLRYAGRAGDR
jgi:peptide subunit release factor 1 (eRF1)